MRHMADRLLLIDGHAAVYRAFYGIRALATRAGRPTNAVYGAIRMVSQLLERWRPSHVAMVFDGGLPASRMALLPEYKAQRSPMPDELREQIPVVCEWLTAFGLTHLRMDAQEADDVLATLATRAAAEGAEALVGTSDKDLFQIVNERIRIVPLAGDGEAMGQDAVEAKTGVRPDQIVDWLALVGDSADNIGGVPGVGVKTAAQLLDQFGTVERLYERLGEVPREKLRVSLEASRELVDRNRRMVALDLGLPTPRTWKQMVPGRKDVETLLRLYEGLEFETLAKALREPELF